MPDVPPPFPELVPPTKLQLTREYVSGGGWGWYGGRTARTLPNPIDDITADFGVDLYDRMLVDPQVAACINVYKASILETGPSITTAIPDKTNPEYDLAKEICDQAYRNIDDLETSFDDVLWNLLDCIALGNKVAEVTYTTGKNITNGKKILIWDKVKVKARQTVLFAVDNYQNIVGLLVATPPNAEPVPGTTYFTDGQKVYGLVPKTKFLISRFREKDSDPRGTSILRSAYSPWWRKQQIIPEYLKYLAQFAGPSLVGITAPEAQPQPDPANPGAMISPVQAMLNALEQFRNMTAIAIPGGSQVVPINMQGDGMAFRLGMGDCNQEITKAILTQELATEEGRHMARAAAQVHQDVLDTIVRQGKLSVQSLIRQQLFRRWVIVNWGEDVAHLAPIADLGATEQRNKPALWQGAAALMNSKYFTEDQLQALDEMLGVPIRQKITGLAFQVVAAQAKKTTAGQPEQPMDQSQEKQQPSAPDRVPVRPHDRRRPQRIPPDNQQQPNDKTPSNADYEFEEEYVRT